MQCKNCLKEINPRNKYCSIKCQKEFEYKEYIYKWKKGEDRMKTVIVTGGAKGIGRAIVCEFASAGYNVVVNYKTSCNEAQCLKEELTKKGQSVESYQADLTKKAEVYDMVEFVEKKFGKIDVLVNNAGISQIKPFADIEENDWDNMVNNNLKTVYLTTKAVLSNMLHYKSGSIINISSIWGITGASCEVHYSATKSAIIGMTKALAKELALSNIRVNAVAPGIIETDMNKELTEQDITLIEDEIPLKRIGQPKEIAKTVKWLAESTYITGQTIRVDGGWII